MSAIATESTRSAPLEVAGLSGPALVAAGIALILAVLLVISTLPKR